MNQTCFSPDDKYIACCFMDDFVTLLDSISGEEVARFEGDKICAVAFSSTERILATGAHEIQLWNLDSKALVRTLSGHKDSVRALSYSCDGKLLASCAQDCTCKLWDTETFSLNFLCFLFFLLFAFCVEISIL